MGFYADKNHGNNNYVIRIAWLGRMRRRASKQSGCTGKPSNRLSSYWVGFITPVAPSVSMPLIEGLKNEVVCREHAIQELIPLQLTSYDEAVRRSLAAEKS